MSKKEKKSTQTKVKEFAYKAASAIGHGIRKVGPYALMGIGVVATVLKTIGNNDDSNKV